MKIPLLRGRFFTDADKEHSPRVAVVDSSFAAQHFPGQDPIGKYVHLLDYDADPNQRSWIDAVVVGVVGHIYQWGLADEHAHSLQAQLYVPFMQSGDVRLKSYITGFGMYLRTRPGVDAQTAFQRLAKALQADGVVVALRESQEELVTESIASQRFALVLLSIFAGLALLLASVGIYGVLSYLVGQRTHEIGVRMALGAQQTDVLRMVLSDGARMMGLGAVLGAVSALALTRLMAGILFGVKPSDPVTFAVVAAFLCAIGLLACYMTARRATMVDPMIALRYE
jgi:hypothetical protein